MSFIIILQPSGKVVHRTTVRKLTPQELEDKTHAKLWETFDKDVASKLGDPMTEAELSTLQSRAMRKTNLQVKRFQQQSHLNTKLMRTSISSNGGCPR
jgi:hypothetical protein